MSDFSDPSLLSQFLAGNSSALEALIRRHTDFVHAVARRRVGPAHAPDVTQAVFILLVQKAHSLRNRLSLLGWLHRAACLCSASLLRRERRRHLHELESLAMNPPHVSATQPAPEIDCLDSLDDALRRLGQSDREVILLHYLQQHDIPHTAAILRISESAARKRAQRGLEKLRALIANQNAAASSAVLASTLQTQALSRAPVTLAQNSIAAAHAAATGHSLATTAAILAHSASRTLRILRWTQFASAAALSITALAAGILISKIAHAAPAPQAAAIQAAAPAPPSAEPFKIQWNFISKPLVANGTPPGLTDPIVSKNILYFGDDAGTLRAVNAKDGNIIWESQHGDRIYSGLVTDDQRLYFTTNKGLYAVDCANGKPVWDLPIEGGASEKGGCLVGANTIEVGGSDGLVYALNATTGEKRWSHHDVVADAPPDAPGFPGEQARLTGARARPTGIIYDDLTIYLSIFDQSRLIALNVRVGAQKWSFQTRGWIGSAAAVNDQFVFIGSQDKSLYCLKKEDGSKVWEFPTRSRIESSPTIVGKTVCIASCDGTLYCLDIATGNLLWNFQTDRGELGGTAIYSKPVILNNSLVFAAGEGQVYALSFDGQLLWKSRPAPGSQLYTNPATDGTRLFLTSRPNLGRGRGAPPPTGQSAIIALQKP